MFKPNLDCVVHVSNGETDLYGQPLPAKRVRERCAVIKLVVENVKSAVRADTSASRGSARELHADSVILLTKNTAANIDDILEVAGQSLKVQAKFPRFDVQGNLDHFEIQASIWS